jgi:ribose-phosphate pyrophosphokinase
MARILDAPIAIIDKRRPRDDTVEVSNVIGDVAGFRCVIVDDLISTGSTLVGAAIALREKGATGVDVVATHGVLTDGAIKVLQDAPIDEICITDTVPFPNGQRSFDDAPKLRILSVASLIAEAIVRVHEGRSVSELFK